mmetsp:Transcript_10170/g.16820  ORF Transcript_10170/g.16820 Transcript_10170/m.16820 type:complete len:84 (-) Transcript_10170:846-1097(-)
MNRPIVQQQYFPIVQDWSNRIGHIFPTFMKADLRRFAIWFAILFIVRAKLNLGRSELSSYINQRDKCVNKSSIGAIFVPFLRS